MRSWFGSDNCTLHSIDTDSVSLLPAQCTVANDTQQCQCSCSPGFILSDHAVETTDGTLCECSTLNMHMTVQLLYRGKIWQGISYFWCFGKLE